MKKLNLRECITRTITYTEVIASYEDETISYVVYGESTPVREVKRIIKQNVFKGIPQIVCNTITEKRAITLENFINNSIIINEGE